MKKIIFFILILSSCLSHTKDEFVGKWWLTQFIKNDGCEFRSSYVFTVEYMITENNGDYYANTSKLEETSDGRYKFDVNLLIPSEYRGPCSASFVINRELKGSATYICHTISDPNTHCIEKVDTMGLKK